MPPGDIALHHGPPTTPATFLLKVAAVHGERGHDDERVRLQLVGLAIQHDLAAAAGEREKLEQNARGDACAMA